MPFLFLQGHLLTIGDAFSINHEVVKHIMQGLKQEEIKDYCNSRLRLAGLVEDIITEPAFEAIYTNLI